VENVLIGICEMLFKSCVVHWTAVINGLLAPFLLLGIILVALDGTLMKGQPSSHASIAVVSLATLLMFGAATGMFVF